MTSCIFKVFLYVIKDYEITANYFVVSLRLNQLIRKLLKKTKLFKLIQLHFISDRNELNLFNLKNNLSLSSYCTSLWSGCDLLHVYTRWIMLSCVFFKAASAVIKCNSGTQLHSVVNLLDCFMAQRQIASQPKTGSAYCSLGVFGGWASNTGEPTRCLFVSSWQTILPGYLWENWTERSNPYTLRMGCVLDITRVTN